MSVIRFKTIPYTIGSRTIVRLPQDASAQLPSRSQVMVKGIVNGVSFHAPLEPDGKGSHWLDASAALQKSARVFAGTAVALAIEATKDWPEPKVPSDIQASLAANSEAQAIWADITPMARWEWIRWINATSQPETRQRRISAAISKLLSGKRRPCCFNRNMCCVPEVSKSGVLLAQKPDRP